MNTINYMTGLLTFYLKGEITTEQNFLKFKVPNTIFGIIPLGSHKENIPVEQIASVASSFRLKIGTLIIGVIITILGLSSLGDTLIGALIFILIGLSIAIPAFKTELLVETTAGKQYYIPFLIFEKGKAEQAENMISTIIHNRMVDTNNRQVAEAQTNAVVDAINNLKN